jgi:hypothetical protein
MILPPEIDSALNLEYGKMLDVIQGIVIAATMQRREDHANQ